MSPHFFRYIKKKKKSRKRLMFYTCHRYKIYYSKNRWNSKCEFLTINHYIPLINNVNTHVDKQWNTSLRLKTEIISQSSLIQTPLCIQNRGATGPFISLPEKHRQLGKGLGDISEGLIRLPLATLARAPSESRAQMRGCEFGMGENI